MSGTVSDGVVTIGDPRLKRPTTTVTDVREVGELIERMTSRVRDLNGAGLAAPQIGESVKAAVVEVRKTDVPDRPTSPLLQMINPVIVDRSDLTERGWEGCFSVPGFMGLVDRAASVTVRYLSPTGEAVEESYSGYVARVIQHETDHLDAIEFVDRMTSMDSLTTVHNYLRHHR
ncbi:MAG: peptide deformylase [Pseudonocardia sp.]